MIIFKINFPVQSQNIMICRLCLTSSLVSATGSCMCNGKALYCVLDAEGLRCVKCQGNTEGRHCERCKEGFYHQRAGESCSSCNCSPTGEDALWSEASDVPLLCVINLCALYPSTSSKLNVEMKSTSLSFSLLALQNAKTSVLIYRQILFKSPFTELSQSSQKVFLFCFVLYRFTESTV